MEYLVKKIDINKDYVNITLMDEVGCTYKHKIHAVAFANNYFSVGNSFDNDFLNNRRSDGVIIIVKHFAIIQKLFTHNCFSSQFFKHSIKRLTSTSRLSLCSALYPGRI